MHILSTKFSSNSKYGILSWRCVLLCRWSCQLSVLILGILLGILTGSASLSAASQTKGRLYVAVIIPDEYARLSMLLEEYLQELKRRIRRVPSRPRITLRLITWENFMLKHGYLTFDALIYIALYHKFPSDLSTSLSNEPQRDLLELLERPALSKFIEPRRFVWLLFKETAQLDQYRLRYPKSPYTSSNTGEASIRKIFSEDIFQFLRRLKELYSFKRP